MVDIAKLFDDTFNKIVNSLPVSNITKITERERSFDISNNNNKYTFYITRIRYWVVILVFKNNIQISSISYNHKHYKYVYSVEMFCDIYNFISIMVN